MNDIQFPTISVAGRDLVVRISIAAQLLMSRRGIDIYKLGEELSPTLPNPAGGTLPNPRYADNLLTIFAACVAENFIDQANPDKVDLNKAPSADYWAMQLHPFQFAEVQTKIHEALGKVSEARRAGLHVVAPPTQETQAS